MSDKPQIEVLEERWVEFYDDTILAVLVRMDGELAVLVPVRQICTVLQINWDGQRQRIMRDDVLSTCTVKVTVQIPPDLQRRAHVCLPLDYLHGWLFGITTSQVSEPYRERIKRYRRECFRVLSAAFQADLLLPDTSTTPPAAPPTVEQGLSLTQIADLGRAITQMAEQQLALEGRVDATHALATDAQGLATHAHARLDKAAEVIRALQRRTATLEDKLHPHAYITDEQAAHIAQLGVRC